jgi:pimeloyl-ACP methyl ester carboxylesterase
METADGPLTAEEIEAAAQALIERATKPRRRARPRLAEPLQDAEDHRIDTPVGPVIAWRLGQGPAVLLVHGWEDDNALWGPMIDRLQANGRPVIAFDLPGHGFSPAEMTGPEAAGKAVRAVAEALGPVEAVIGHSFGCIALTLALADGLAAERAVLIASPIPRTRGRSLDRALEGEAPEVAARVREIMAARQSAAPPVFDMEAAVARLGAVKALIVHSMDDDDCPPANAQLLADAWPGAELLWVDGLGHRRVAQDGDVLTRIADFIDGLG